LATLKLLREATLSGRSVVNGNQCDYDHERDGQPKKTMFHRHCGFVPFEARLKATVTRSQVERAAQCHKHDYAAYHP
jgi:hypothetical protein